MTLDRRALRRELGRREDLREYEGRVPKATARPEANAAIVWRHFTTSVYQSGDIPILATREALQNSVDAIRAAVRSRKLPAGTGRFAVNWNPADHSLSWEDNGIGMDTDTIRNKFLKIGESGKTDAADSGEAAGGFGVAKAVILGASRTFRWQLHSRNNLAVSSGTVADIDIFEEAPRIGTRIIVFDVDSQFDTFYDYARRSWVPIAQRLHDLLGANNLDGIELVLNGEVIGRSFSRSKGTRLADGGDWGTGTTAVVKGYKRSDRQGAFYVRLNGLFMFVSGSNSRNLPLDVIIDLSSTVRPGDRAYPLNSSRESLQGLAGRTFEELRRQIEQESESSARDEEAEILDPERSDVIAAGTLAAFSDADFRASMEGAATGLADWYAAMGPRSVGPATSNAPAGSPKKTPIGLPIGGATATKAGDAAGFIRDILGEADEAVAAGGGERSTVLTPLVEQVLARSAEGKLAEPDVQVLADAVERVNAAALGPGGGGLLQIASVARVHNVLGELAATPPKAPKNPFGSLAGVYIAKSYPHQRAAAFKRNFSRWLPHLTAWDATLRLVSAEVASRPGFGGLQRRFFPGFVLDDEAGGMAAAGPTGPVVYIHPDRFAEYIKAHRDRPIAIASFLHGTACHELAHLDGRLGKGHNEEFVKAREHLQKMTAHLIEPLAVLLTRVLDLPAREAPEQKALRKVREQLARSKADSPSATEVRTLREKLARMGEELAAANLRASEQAARAAESRCRCRNAPTSTTSPPPDPGAWENFAELVAAELLADDNYRNARPGDNARTHHELTLATHVARLASTHLAHYRSFADDPRFSAWLRLRTFALTGPAGLGRAAQRRGAPRSPGLDPGLAGFVRQGGAVAESAMREWLDAWTAASLAPPAGHSVRTALAAPEVLRQLLHSVRQALVPAKMAATEFDAALAGLLPGLQADLAERIAGLPWGGLVPRSSAHAWHGAAVDHGDRSGTVQRLRRGGMRAEVNFGDTTKTVRATELRLREST